MAEWPFRRMAQLDAGCGGGCGIGGGSADALFLVPLRSRERLLPMNELLLVLLATNFSGHWQGEGTLTQKGFLVPPQSSPCAKVELQLEHLPEKLTIAHYHAICGIIDSEWGPSVMEI